MEKFTFLFLLCLIVFTYGVDEPDGFNGAKWGDSPEEVKKKVEAKVWQSDPIEKNFPANVNIKVYKTSGDVAGYKASTKYYFIENRLFQATIDFGFEDLKNFDFNYNVFRSVNEYYLAIKNRTVHFVNDIYDLLKKKYGKKKPFFEKLNPESVFTELEKYIERELWNLRYHPYDFYLHIVTSSYAVWDFPETKVIFSVNISAPEKRFDYKLSLSSQKMTKEIGNLIDSLRSKGL
ncbi:MAG: hypothetical protein N2053_01955 [Chitinispirillaceae bacterium]|nr:hypothetical protein [Chitinispirillaceae bacterium]